MCFLIIHPIVLQGNEPSGINIIHQVVLGNRATMDAVFCGACGEPNSTKRCAKCKMVSRPSAEC